MGQQGIPPPQKAGLISVVLSLCPQGLAFSGYSVKTCSMTATQVAGSVCDLSYVAWPL